MRRYFVDRMIVADSRFTGACSAASMGMIELVLVEEIMYESRGDKNYSVYKEYGHDSITREHVAILKSCVVNRMIDCGALLPNEGTGETMIATEYWIQGVGTQTSLFDLGSQSSKVVVTNDKKALKFFDQNGVQFMKGVDFFNEIANINSISQESVTL